MESFKELSLHPSLMTAIAEMGFDKPTPIQAQTLPILLGEPTDFLGLAATGTGKTAAFGIPMLERLSKMDASNKCVKALILCPTRELAIQVAGQINLMARHLGTKALPVYGGASYGDQMRGLRSGASIVVGTPGRVVDHITRGSLKLDELSICILDEADEMISMGFKDDLELILGQAPESSMKWMFSATMSPEVRRVADEYLNEPGQVQVNRTEMLPENLEQIYYPTRESDKPEILCKLIDAADEFYGIVFCQTKSLVTDLTQYLVDRGYRVDCLHGDKDQNARERTMKAFRDRRVNMLICTDVASRGLDVKDITHVINYSLPRELDSYVHRIGRTARSGKQGYAMSLVTPSHRGLIARIERMTKSRMIEGKLPTRKDLGMKKVSSVLPKLMEQKNFARALELMDQPWKDALTTMTMEEIVGRFLSLNFPEVFADREAIDNAKPGARTAPAAANGVVIRSDDRGSNRGDRGGYRGAGGGGYTREGGYAKRGGGYANRSEGGYKREGGYTKREGAIAGAFKPREAGSIAPVAFGASSSAPVSGLKPAFKSKESRYEGARARDQAAGVGAVEQRGFAKKNPKFDRKNPRPWGAPRVDRPTGAQATKGFRSK